jgi:hypothetical protein
MKPEWKKFKKMALAKYSNLQGAILEIDSSVMSQLTNPLLTNNVNGYPSLFIISNNKILKYNNERTAFEFMKFFKLHIHKSQSRTSKSKASKSKASKSRTSKSRTSKSRASKSRTSKSKASKSKASKSRTSKSRTSKSRASKSRTSKSKLYYPKSFRRFIGNKS